jgi:dipeptidyl-peptidase 4
MSYHARAARLLSVACLFVLIVYGSPSLTAQNAAPPASAPALAPNYELAANWTSQKVSKLVFDTNVNARWLEGSDRFWYAYQTRDGRRFHLVDPLKKSKAPLFDHVKMAATLTSITRLPYDAQHLPFSTVRSSRTIPPSSSTSRCPSTPTS